MPRLTWDGVGERYYETGVKNCALYVFNNSTKAYGTGVPWNGISSITESPSGAESNPIYADDIKYLDLISTEEFGCTIEAYTYPKEFEQCDGSAQLAVAGVKMGQQSRKSFGLAYITTVGNDTDNNDYGKKLHLIYGCKAAPSEAAYNTINDSPEANTFSWEITTTPVAVTKVADAKPTSRITIESAIVGKKHFEAILDKIFGKDAVGTDNTAKLLTPDELYTFLTSDAYTSISEDDDDDDDGDVTG